MRQSFLFIYFVLYLVAVVALLPAAGGGRIPCKDLADSLANVLSQPVALDLPRVVHVQLPRLTMGERVLDTKPASTEIRAYLTGTLSDVEREGVTYEIRPLDSAPALQCKIDSTTGAGILSQTFQKTGRYRYTVVGRFRRHVPAALPTCVREMLQHLDGLSIEARSDLEIQVAASDFRTPC